MSHVAPGSHGRSSASAQHRSGASNAKSFDKEPRGSTRRSNTSSSSSSSGSQHSQHSQHSQQQYYGHHGHGQQVPPLVRPTQGVMAAASVVPACLAPTTGQLRSGHMEVDTLFGGSGAAGASKLTVNSMNAPNNSTMQCGCENIDCPFCNLMMSVQMKNY